MPQEGQTIGKYVLEDRLGQGGYGKVWKARHHFGGYAVAIKFAPADKAEIFAREARRLQHLDCPHIVPILEIRDQERALVMEYARAGNLRQWATDHKPAKATWLHLLEQVAEALDCIHAQNIVHGDVKPENILVNIEGDAFQAWLADFGLAGPEADLRRGTLHYLAPEQVLRLDDPAHPFDGQADQYALALVAYELLTGRLPFPIEGRDATALARIRLNKPPTPPSEHEPSFVAFDDPLLKALSRDPAARYPSCRAFVAALWEAERRSREDLADSFRKALEEALRQANLEAAREALTRLQNLLQPLPADDDARARYFDMLVAWQQAHQEAQKAREAYPNLRDPDGLFRLLNMLPPGRQRRERYFHIALGLLAALPLGFTFFYLALLWICHKGP